jgi:DNA anti-recombination protein RmuC
MESWEILVEGGVALASGCAGAGAILWNLSNKLSHVLSEARSAKLAAEALEKRIDKLEEELGEDRKEAAEQWQHLNRTLGRIEGAMGETTENSSRPRLPGGRK